MTRRSCAAAMAGVLLVAALAAPAGTPSAETPIDELFKYGSIGSEDQEGLPYNLPHERR